MVGMGSGTGSAGGGGGREKGKGERGNTYGTYIHILYILGDWGGGGKNIRLFVEGEGMAEQKGGGWGELGGGEGRGGEGRTISPSACSCWGATVRPCLAVHTVGSSCFLPTNYSTSIYELVSI